MKRSWILIVLGIGLWLFGVSMAAKEYKGLSARKARLSQLKTDLEFLEEKAAESGAIEGHLLDLENRSKTEPIDLKQLDKSLVLGPAQENIFRGFWSTVKRKAAFTDMTWKDLSGLIEQAESQDPPWRPVALDVAPSGDGKGSGSITFQSLKRAP